MVIEDPKEIFASLTNLIPEKEFIGIYNKYYIFYITRNLINNKVYFGAHSSPSLSDGYLGSGKHLQNAISKYGISNFYRCNLKFFNTRTELLNYERLVINAKFLKYIKENDLGYNLGLGGTGTGFYCGDKHSSVIRVENGTNPFLRRPDGSSWTSDNQKFRLENGLHHFVGASKYRSLCIVNKYPSVKAWFLADKISELRSKRLSKDAISKAIGAGYGSTRGVIDNLALGWVPVLDDDWKAWKLEMILAWPELAVC